MAVHDNDMPSVLPVHHPRGGGVACLASGTWRVREWWYTGETLSSARQRQHAAYTMQLDSESGGGGGGGRVAGGGGVTAEYDDDGDLYEDDSCDEYDDRHNHRSGGDGDGRGRRRRGWGGTRGEFVGFGEDGVDAFTFRGWIYPLGQGETTSQNMASASVWGTDAENSESVAEFMAKHAVRDDEDTSSSPAAIAAAAADERERDEEENDDVVAGGLRRQQLVRFFKNYSVGGSSTAYRGFADAHGVWGVAKVLHTRQPPRVFRAWRVREEDNP